ncbi:hypothetical protein NQ176_g5670 [Zarea fungicola]|uniref:Uncharacterized protein n=1 Tax=Zarea fungicola TaxID=93591 RepID=A0ACC1N7B1_9HYPO|nr:hypothetical protein NQ176_g5670 [Lecanicillium fungicola]
MATPSTATRGVTPQQPHHRSSASSSSGSEYRAYQATTERSRHLSSSSSRSGGIETSSTVAGRRDSGAGIPRFLGQFKSWLSVSEPSAQAMKSQKREAFRKHGIDPKDPEAAAKMHLPLGTLPRDATTSTSGPTPEKRLAKERRNRPQSIKHGSVQSVSSGGSSNAPSVSGEMNQIAPWMS